MDNRTRFLLSLFESFSILCNEEDLLLNIEGDIWETWQRMFEQRNCSAIWQSWYLKYGIPALRIIEKHWEDISMAMYAQSIFYLDNANESKDKEMVADTLATVIERIRENIKKGKLT